MIEMGVRVEDMCDGQTQLTHFLEYALGGSAGIDDDGSLRNSVADYGAVAPERRHRKCFSNKRGHTTACYRSRSLRRKQRPVFRVRTADRPDHFRVIDGPISPLPPEPHQKTRSRTIRT